MKPGESATIDTGVACSIPIGYFGKLESKSGLNVKHSVVSLGGTIDAGYRGNIVVKLYNFGSEPYHFERGDKIVQMVLIPCLCADIDIVDELDESERGTGGFGSTGK
jgi:dUTP pyrophosphatase